METLIMKNVGDGLNLLLINNKHFNLTIDFGGNENLEPSWCFYENFILSHHHFDHYNGILKCYKEKTGCWHLTNFYFPLMPRFPEKEEFYLALFSINRYLNPNHPIQTTLISIINKLNKRPVITKPLKKGDKITIDRNEYTILWPPEELTDEKIRKDVKNAINDFYEAKKEDKDLEKIYERIKDLPFESSSELKDAVAGESIKTESVINPKVQKANKSLRKVANRLSIAFKQDNNLLFLGDLESTEIKKVIVDLLNDSDNHFNIIVSAHHGTHFQKSILYLKSDIVLASVGKKYKGDLNSQYKYIADEFLNTHDSGDIVLKKKFVVS